MRTSVSAMAALCSLMALDTAAGNYLLDNEFCQHYYPLDQGLPPCQDVRSHVTANLSTTLPILELGDRSKPSMFFVHGWPDSAAEWAPQLAHFCAPPHGKYHCVAASWQNFDPDVPMADESDLRLQVAIDKLAATIRETGLDHPEKDTTLVIHDWGAFLGYQLMAQYPNLTKRTVAFDIGFIGAKTTNISYQAINRESWNKQDSSISIANAARFNAPSLTFATWQRSWPYCLSTDSEPCSFNSMEGLNYTSPSWDKPLLFMYGTVINGNPRPLSQYFFGAGWLEQVHATPHGETVAVPSDHWMHIHNASTVNANIEGWLYGLRVNPK